MTLTVTNPATDQPIGEVPDCSPTELDAAMTAAAAAQPEWAGDEEGRRISLHKAAEVLTGAAADLAPLLVAEQGKPRREAKVEVITAAAMFGYYADLEIPRRTIQDDDTARVEVTHRPLGVVAAITPWNFPLLLACVKLAPALLAGNTVVLKPSPDTPLTTVRLGELLAELLPAGVFTVVTGGDALGSQITSHPVPRKVSFTGSVVTGKQVAQAAAPDLKRLTLELGGNDPAILLDDVDPASVAARLFWSAFTNCGQACSAIKRIYVPERRHEELAEALGHIAGSVKVGDGMDDSTRLGPLTNRPQQERVRGLVRDAVERGAKAAAGGEVVDGPGYFHPPTILSGADDGMRIVDEEQFGPALPLIPYRDLDDALRRANATHFGLSGSVWGEDEDRAAAVAARLECGTAWVNTHLALGPDQPFGGAKWSGVGVEAGPWGLLAMTDVHVLYRSRAGIRSS